MKRTKFYKKLFPSFILILSLCGQTVYAQEAIGMRIQQQEQQEPQEINTELPKSAMRVNMYTDVDDQSDIKGYKEIEVTVTWVESLEMKEPVTISVTEDSKILIEDIEDVKFETNGTEKEISNLSIQENSVKFMTGLAEKRSNCSLTYKVRTPIAVGEFKISTKVAADNAPTTQSNSVERAFNVTTGLTVETTYDIINSDTSFDVFGLVNYKTEEQNPDLLISLDIYNEETGEFVYELTGADYPKDNTYKIGSMSFPDNCEDGTYIVYVTLMDGMDIIGSASKKIQYINKPNSAPTRPVITRTPDDNSIMPNTPVTITASSTDPEGDPFTYVWEGRPNETSVYPLGKNVIRVKAVDNKGAESPWAAIVFFVMDSNGSGGMMLTGPDSTIVENGIEGATITRYNFNVPPVVGHSGSDYGRVRGYNVNTGTWDQLDYGTTSNGISFTRNLTPGVYSKLEFYYYTNHSCMYNKSNITYTVSYYFD